MVLQRIFDALEMGAVNSHADDKRLSIEAIRHVFHQALHDCKTMGAQQLIYKINVAPAPSDLWPLLGDLQHCIAKTHGQSQTTERINALLPAFEGWLPAGQLKQI